MSATRHVQPISFRIHPMVPPPHDASISISSNQRHPDQPRRPSSSGSATALRSSAAHPSSLDRRVPQVPYQYSLSISGTLVYRSYVSPAHFSFLPLMVGIPVVSPLACRCVFLIVSPLVIACLIDRLCFLSQLRAFGFCTLPVHFYLSLTCS